MVSEGSAQRPAHGDSTETAAPAVPQIAAFDAIPWTSLPDGVRRKVYFSDRMTLVLWEFTRTARQGDKVKLHSHPHEQITYIVSGKGMARVSDMGKAVSAGDILIVPGDVLHGVQALSDKLVFIDVFTPAREDFRAPAPSK